MTHVDPTRERFGAFKNLPQGEPVHMLNLVRLRDKAVYPDGRDATGRAAYQAYSRESGPVFRRLGGRQLWIGRQDVTLIGPEDERWDIAFIAEYPSGAAFIEMVRDPVYREAVKHRQAAVADSRLIRISREYPARDSGKKDNRIRVLNLRGAIVRSVTAPDVERSPPEKRNHAPHSPVSGHHGRFRLMRKIIFVVAALFALGAAPQSAEAQPGGCLKYGLGGAVAGHVAGGHRWKGAAIGCVLGIYQRRRHLARSRDLERSRTADRNRYDDRRPPVSRDRARPYDRNETGSIGGGFERGGAFIRGGS